MNPANRKVCAHRVVSPAAIHFFFAGLLGSTAAQGAPPSFAGDVYPVFRDYCIGCHNADDWEGDLSLETYAAMMAGGESGEAVVPGDAGESLLWQVTAGESKPKMPPKREPQPPAEAVALLKAWIDVGAPGPPPGREHSPVLSVPDIPTGEGVIAPVTATAFSPGGARLAVARFGKIDLLDGVTMEPLVTLADIPGKVNAVTFSRDGSLIVAATGVTGASGEAIVWDTATGQKRFSVGLEKHRDILFDAVLSPDRSLLATAGYDRNIQVWDGASGAHLSTIEGHNGAIFDLAFSPDGAVLASASADETTKLWSVGSGERLDTLHQPEGEQFAVIFTPGSESIITAGADNRIRQYQFVSKSGLAINPLLQTRFAHEGTVVALAVSPDGRWLVSSADDRTLSLWSLPGLELARRFPVQPDIVSDLAVGPSSRLLVASRMDGSVESFGLSPEIVGTASSPRHGAGASQAHAAPADENINAPPPTPPAGAAEVETEPNDDAGTAQASEFPIEINGAIGSDGDVDVFRFFAKAGDEWVIEVRATGEQAPLDPRVEVLDAEGQPVERVRLQAVRNSWFTFRGKDSTTIDDFRVHNWEEMELNDYLYAGGEVTKLWLYPRGPDSGFKVYPGFGKRFTYFGTTARSHALGEPCYIVQPRRPGEPVPPNGLPAFPIYFENDDDPRREGDKNSYLDFSPPVDSIYHVRVSDVRNFGGDAFQYTLIARPRTPSFGVKVDGADNLTVNAGSGKEFTLRAERRDGFEGAIHVTIEGLPPGFSATSPVVIEAGQESAIGLINALPDAPSPAAGTAKNPVLTARAVVRGEEVTFEAGSLGEIKLAGKPKLLVGVTPAGDLPFEPTPDNPLTLRIRAGETISANVTAERNGFDGRIEFGKEDSGRNLPHGVYVDNIGLNGLLIVEGQSTREFFVTAAKWVKPTTRLFHLRTTADGTQCSWPVRLEVTE